MEYYSRWLTSYAQGAAAIAPWYRLQLPSFGHGFETQANHLHFLQFELLKL